MNFFGWGGGWQRKYSKWITFQSRTFYQGKWREGNILRNLLIHRLLLINISHMTNFQNSRIRALQPQIYTVPVRWYPSSWQIPLPGDAQRRHWTLGKCGPQVQESGPGCMGPPPVHCHPALWGHTGNIYVIIIIIIAVMITMAIFIYNCVRDKLP